LSVDSYSRVINIFADFDEKCSAYGLTNVKESIKCDYLLAAITPIPVREMIANDLTVSGETTTLAAMFPRILKHVSNHDLYYRQYNLHEESPAIPAGPRMPRSAPRPPARGTNESSTSSGTDTGQDDQPRYVPRCFSCGERHRLSDCPTL
jgi:hypothetical protein